MAKILITEQQFKKLVENNINELSSELLSRAAQEAFDNDDNRVRKFRYGAVNSLEKEHPSFGSYPVERNKDTEFLQKNKNLKIQSFDSDYKTLDDLYNGVKQGKLLIHCRGMQGEETLETIYPEIGETVMEFYGEYTDEEEYGESLVHELVFASDDFNWARNSRDAVYFVYSDNFVRSLGDGRVQTPNGEIYYNENLSASVEIGDWFSYEPASVVAVMRLNNNVVETVMKEYLDKNMTKVRKGIKNSHDDWGYSWAENTDDGKEIIKNEWMIHFSDMKTSMNIASNGFKYGNSYNKEPEQVTYQVAKDNVDFFNYAYLATDVLAYFENGGQSMGIQPFLNYLMNERQDCFVMFKGNGYRFLHVGDSEEQVVFNDIQPDTKVLIVRIGDNYCVVNGLRIIPRKNNRKSLKGESGLELSRYNIQNPKNDYSNILYYSCEIEKVIKWVMQNYEQYSKNLNYKQ